MSRNVQNREIISAYTQRVGLIDIDVDGQCGFVDIQSEKSGLSGEIVK